jgi:Tfp pilus assembly protein PilP
MKRTLALCLLCGLAASVMAQTPTIVEKVVAPVKSANAAKEAQVNAALGKSAPSEVRVVAVPAKPPAIRPAVIAVQPAKTTVVKPAAPKSASSVHTKPTVAVVPAKPAAGATRVVAVKPKVQAVKVAPAVKVSASGVKEPFSRKQARHAVKAAPAVAEVPKRAKTRAVVAVSENKSAEDPKKPEPKKISAAERRDPFLSPVVRLGSTGSGCSTGKRCLAIDQVLLKGVVRSENGMIAVVVNSLNKAYFLRENDPVFNGYVTRITPDSIIFKETFRDRLGKELTRDVTKTISRPAA